MPSPRPPAGSEPGSWASSPTVSARAVRAGGRLIVVPTNASSYVGDEVPATELAAARLRAREFGRAVLQAAPTGYSAIVLSDGDALARTELGAAAMLRGQVPLLGADPFRRTGDYALFALPRWSSCRPGPARGQVPGLARRATGLGEALDQPGQ